MAKIMTLLTALFVIAGCRQPTVSYQLRDASSYGEHTRTQMRSPRGDTTIVESYDSTAEYYDCLANINRRNLDGMEADDHCKRWEVQLRNQGAYGPTSGYGHPGISPSDTGPMGTYYPGRLGNADTFGGPYDPMLWGQAAPAYTVAVYGDEPRLRDLETRADIGAEQGLANARRIEALETASSSTPPTASPQTASPTPAPTPASPPGDAAKGR